MDWAQADPLTEIDGRIALIEADRAAWQHQLEDSHEVLVRAEHQRDHARAATVRAEHLVDAARAQETEARLAVREDNQELATLRDERAKIVPGPRRP